MRLASFNKARPIQDPVLANPPTAKDVFDIGGVFLSLLRAQADKDGANFTAEQAADPALYRASFAYGPPSDAALDLMARMRTVSGVCFETVTGGPPCPHFSSPTHTHIHTHSHHAPLFYRSSRSGTRRGPTNDP